MKIADRYATAVHSGNLGSRPETTASDSDVLGAAGLAAKQNPLGIALMRLLSGDNHASADVVRILADLAWDKARRDGIKLRRVQAEDVARAVLAWCRDGTCTRCGGHGFKLIPGAPSLSEVACPACQGGKLHFAKQFPMMFLDVAWWLREQIERETARSGPAVMKALAEAMP